MKKINKLLTLWGIGAAAVLTAMALTAATYAWFTSNREVETEQVTSRTGSSEVELQLSRAADKWDDQNTSVIPLKGSEDLPLPEEIVLMPVSTSDLKTFIFNSATQDGFAEKFEKAADENLYYHDTFYLRAKSDDSLSDDAVMALYLDTVKDVPIVGPEGGEILIAARLGLKFSREDAKGNVTDETSVIMTLSEVNEGTGNTRPGGVPLESGKVLTYDAKDEKVVPAEDPAVPLTDVQIPLDGGAARRPLTELTPNVVYTVDVYLYLEGCDPDCLSNKVGMKDATLNLAFFGVLS